jgi:hypothetical protein
MGLDHVRWLLDPRADVLIIGIGWVGVAENRTTGRKPGTLTGFSATWGRTEASQKLRKHLAETQRRRERSNAFLEGFFAFKQNGRKVASFDSAILPRNRALGTQPARIQRCGCSVE